MTSRAAGPRPLALASLTALHVPPPELVRAAARAGFDMVGPLRLNRTRNGAGWDLLGDRALRQATRAALAETGLGVLDVEVLRLRAPGPHPGPDAAALLHVGAELGAQFLLCTIEDPEPDRRVEAFATVCGSAAEVGLRCVVEPMALSAVRAPADALALLQAAGAAGAGLLVDPLHLSRSGSSPADLDGVAPSLLPYAQLCDALRDGPALDPQAYLAEAVSSREAPGEGRLPLLELLHRLPADAPLSLEVPSPHAAQDLAGWLLRLVRATRALETRAGPGAAAPGPVAES